MVAAREIQNGDIILNSTSLGDYHQPTVRFSGSGGANDVASFVNRTLIFMKQEKRKFVGELDYLTSPGRLDGPDGRKRAGLAGGGPEAVITDMAVMRFDAHTRRMYLAEYYPGIDVDTIKANMGFDLDCTRAIETRPPSSEELRILRERCDPQRLIVG